MMAIHTSCHARVPSVIPALYFVISGSETVSQLPFLSFRASEARHGIQYFQQVLDAGFRRHDGVDSTFYYFDTVSRSEIQSFYLFRIFSKP